MLCRCRNIDILPRHFVVGQYYRWTWHDWDREYVRVTYNDFFMMSEIMSLDDFLHCFEIPDDRFYCRCKNTDLFPSYYTVGEIYRWDWYDCHRKKILVTHEDFLIRNKIMSREDFLHCFEIIRKKDLRK